MHVICVILNFCKAHTTKNNRRKKVIISYSATDFHISYSLEPDNRSTFRATVVCSQTPIDIIYNLDPTQKKILKPPDTNDIVFAFPLTFVLFKWTIATLYYKYQKATFPVDLQPTRGTWA